MVFAVYKKILVFLWSIFAGQQKTAVFLRFLLVFLTKNSLLFLYLEKLTFG